MRLTKEMVSKALQAAFDKKSHEAAARNQYQVGSVRLYDCDVPGCNRVGFSKGKCHVHYKRERDGKDLSAPIRNRKAGGVCLVCGELSNGKGAWSLCAKHFKAERYTLVKQTLIDLMGGECALCKGKFQHAVYDFHHLEGKEHGMSRVLINNSIDTIATEAVKCILLCANCHRMEHSNGGL